MTGDNEQNLIENTTSLYNRLRGLQADEQNSTSALLLERATRTFDLHGDPVPQEAQDRALVVVYPQDPFVGEPEVRTMSRHDIQSGLVNGRVRIQDSRTPPAQPDSDGNYLFWPGSAEFDQVNAFYFTTFTLRMFERYARRSIPWAFPAARITVDPHYGVGPHAFYSERDRLLGFHSFQVGDDMAGTAWSADIVTHEAAHAVLDGLRDLHNESFGLGPMAFHESFGDMAAMLVALHDDSLIRTLIEWTKGDLRLDNFVAKVAEQLGDTMQRDENQYLLGHTLYLRNAINGLRKMPFDELMFIPGEPELELGRQSHNYSRLFTGAFYDILVGIYDRINLRMPSHIAIYQARNIVAYLLTCAVELGPVGEFDFSDMARAFLAADHVLYRGRYGDVMKTVFRKRNLLQPEQADRFLDNLRDLPEITLPRDINSAPDAAKFLERDILPALNLEPAPVDLVPLAAYRNAIGNAFLTYASAQQISLEGGEFGDFQNSSFEVFGGLSLMFDAQNRLRSYIYRPVNTEDIRQIKVQITEMIARDIITDLNRFPSQNIGPDDGTSQQLLKSPIIFDQLPTPVTSLLEYLDKIKPHID